MMSQGFYVALASVGKNDESAMIETSIGGLGLSTNPKLF